MRTLVLLAALALTAPALHAGGDDPVAQAETSTSTNAGSRWGAEYFPNVPLVTQDGETVHFFDDLIKDKVVVINFIYTSCPDACPLETAKLVEVYSLLKERVGKDVFMYSISIDPLVDTPPVLKEYKAKFQIGPEWLFLTGTPADIKTVRHKLGMIRPNEEALSDHTLSLLIGNQATGQWMKRSPMENPSLLATQIGSWLHGWKEAPQPGHDYKDAPKLRNLSRGEDLFRTRCMTCHKIGADDGIIRQGPNITGVTERRERAWLKRWISEPDKMLAEKDPIAVDLLVANRFLPMPNMRLNELEVDSLIEFIEQESRYFEEAQAAKLQAEADWDAPDSGKAFEKEKLPPCCQKREGLVLDEEDEADEADGTVAAPSEPVQAAPAPIRLPPAAPRAARPAPETSDARGVSLAVGASTLLCLGLALALGILSLASGKRDFS